MIVFLYFQAMILIKFHSPTPTSRHIIMNFRNFEYDMISSGIWGSLLFGSAGILGICAAYDRTKSMYANHKRLLLFFI